MLLHVSADRYSIGHHLTDDSLRTAPVKEGCRPQEFVVHSHSFFFFFFDHDDDHSMYYID